MQTHIIFPTPLSYLVLFSLKRFALNILKHFGIIGILIFPTAKTKFVTFVRIFKNVGVKSINEFLLCCIMIKDNRATVKYRRICST